MNEYGEFKLDEISSIREKIDYIRINDTKYKDLKFDQLLIILIQSAIDNGKGEALEAGRLIKFTGNEINKYEKQYKGYTFVIPGRNQQKIEKAIKVLKVAFESPDIVYIKFQRDSQEIYEDQLFEKQQQYNKKLNDEKYFIARQLFDIDEEKTDEELRKEIKANYTDIDIMMWELDHLDKVRESNAFWKMEKIYTHIKRKLNDVKQAELLEVSLEEYIEKYKEANIQSDEKTMLFLNYVHSMQETINQGYIIENYMYDRGFEEITFD